MQMTRSTKGCFYTMSPRGIEVSLGLQFEKGEDDFQDATFLVTNCENKKRAIGRVEKFVKMLADEFGGE